MLNHRDTSTPGEFLTKKCYRLYKEAVERAMVVNKAIEDGHQVKEDGMPLIKFSFRYEGLPALAQVNGAVHEFWFGNPTQDNSKVDWTDVRLKDIKKRFDSLKIEP